MMANVTLIAKLLPMFIILIAAIAVGSHMPDLNPVPTDAEEKPWALEAASASCPSQCCHRCGLMRAGPTLPTLEKR